MATVIFKWNPEISSYEMERYLADLQGMNTGWESDSFNWSVWEYEKVHDGDKFYMLKVGHYGQLGILMSGLVTSEPYQDEDWSGQGRTTYYVDYFPDFMLNPDAMPIISCDILESAIPDFDWRKGHSGLVLSDEQAVKLEALVAKFKADNAELFKVAERKEVPDRIYEADYDGWLDD